MDERARGDEAAAQAAAQELAAQADTGARELHGTPRRVIYTAALCWSLFQLWIASPLPFWFHVLIFNDTQARAIHLAFALFLAFLSFPGLVGHARRVPVFAVLYLLAGLALLGRAAMQAMAGTDNPLIFGAVGATLLVVAWAAFRPVPRTLIPQIDWVLALAGALSSLYLFIFYVELSHRPGAPTLFDLVTAGCGMVLLLEATRRSLGPALTTIAVVFLIYTFAGPYMPDMIAHRGASFSRTMSQQWLTAEGVFGIALGVSTSFVFLFVLFGAMLEKAGAGNYFIQVAFSLLGHMRGGPAKAAVVASGLTGLISGSSIANVVTTGTFTIPLMKRVGFSAEKAGAVEVASSVNGQIMPPVMGAAAFLMVEYVGIPYVEVITHAFLPAVISYIALLYIVHLEALKMGMSGLPRREQTTLVQSLLGFGITVCSLIILAGAIYYGIGWTRDVFGPAANLMIAGFVLAAYLALLLIAAQVPELTMDDPQAPLSQLPAVRPTLLSGLHFLLPLVVLIWTLIVERLSPGLSAFWAVAFMVFILITQRPILALFRGQGAYGRAVTIGLVELVDGLVAGARNMVGIGVATAAAGIIVGTVALTGIGLVMTELVEYLSGGNLMLMLVLTALISLILGLGLPTTANYIIVATLMAPVVVELGSQSGLVVPLIAVHLFVFYFGIMADVTPPVGLASFAAAAVSRGDPLQTGIQAFYYSLRTVALPFIFVFNYELLLIGIGSIWHLLVVVLSAIVAMLVFAAGTQGYFLARSRLHESALLLLVAFMLFRPGFFLDQIMPEYDELPARALLQVVEEVPAQGFLRMRVEGVDMDGRDVSKVVMFRLGETGPAAQRLRGVGLGVAAVGEQVNITDVAFGSPAERFGVEFGWHATAVLVPSAERPPKEIVYVPALLLLGLVALLQRPRARRGDT
ncbi:TRAP transporter permease [Elioraea sp.]|uniref:TRAP transporter permease n=1 Tax=Elioraea sp. TaxID=2185103 RepID=UPI003F7040FF